MKNPGFGAKNALKRRFGGILRPKMAKKCHFRSVFGVFRQQFPVFALLHPNGLLLVKIAGLGVNGRMRLALQQMTGGFHV